MNIDSSYFTSGRRQIENATEGGGIGKQTNAVNYTIEMYIKEYSPMFLKKVLGKDMADRVMEDDGTDASLKAIFDALKYPMADFVMFQILKYSGRMASIKGLLELKCGNKVIAPAIYQANVWNEMVDGLRDFCVSYPEMRVDNCLLSKISSCWV